MLRQLVLGFFLGYGFQQKKLDFSNQARQYSTAVL
jgi:hypothetical protein